MIDRMQHGSNGNGKSRGAIVLTSEVFGSRIAIRDLIGHLVRNPDELYQKDKDGYERILANPIVKSQITDLFAPIIASDCEVETGDDDADKVLTEIINGCPAIEEFKEQALFAYVTGVRFIEVIWGTRKIEGVTYTVPVDFSVHNEQRFAFDEFGHLWMTKDDRFGRNGERNNVALLSDSKNRAMFIPQDKMIIHRYRDGNGRYGYGNGEGLDLWRHVKAWDAAYSFFIDYAQSYGNPFKVLKVDPEYIREKAAHGESPDDVVAALLAQLQSLIGNDTYVTDGRNELSLLTPEAIAPDTFTKLLDKIEANIKLTITGELVSTDAGDRGSFALARVAREKPVGRQRRLTKMLDRTMSSQLLGSVLWLNAGRFDGIEGGKVTTKMPAIEPAQRLEFMLKSPFPVLRREFFNLAELTEPTADQIASGEAIVPNVEIEVPGLSGF